ncbi:hypothetical protein [Caldimonas brevitalea]|uniref:hypothetical protein n=1 Tax=Caldimonas brevitalea TaxID=413882 RepID=UPI0012F84EDA|nr:hypothetical protein [Caldimonas brevitalea]
MSNALQPKFPVVQIKNCRLILTALAIAGFLFNFYVFYPGFLTSDAVDQYSQALRHQYSDWHPPFMAMLWSTLLPVLPDAIGMLALISAGLWGGVALFAFRLTSQVSYRGLLVFVVPLLPVVLNFSGMIWKDVLHAALWTLACGILINDDGKARPASILIRALSVLLILAGTLARPNSIFASFPLLVWALRDESTWKTMGRAVVAVCLFAAAAVGLNKLMDVGRDQAETSIQIYNLGGISHYTGKNAFPGTWTPEESKKITDECFTRHSWDNYIWSAAPPRADCSFVTQKLRDQGFWGSAELTRVWLDQIISHPKEYLQSRLQSYQNFLRKPTQGRSIKDAATIVGGEVQKAPKHSLLTVAVIAYSTELAKVFRPWVFCFIAIACMAWVVSRWRSASNTIQFSYAMLCSATIYALSYFPLGVASDLRYFYWSYISISIAAVVIYLNAASHRSRQGESWRSAPIGISLSCALIVVGLLITALFPV